MEKSCVQNVLFEVSSSCCVCVGGECVFVLETHVKRLCLFVEVQIFSCHLFLTTRFGSTAVTFTYFNVLLCFAHIFNNLNV